MSGRLKIMLLGPTGSGKTTAAAKIAELLSELGASVTVEDSGVKDSSIKELLAHASEIMNGREVTIVTVTTSWR